MTGDQVVARARRLIGVRFRAQGRDPAFGVDCVGLVAAALGHQVAADQPVRCADVARVAAGAAALGLRRCEDPRAGDVALFETGPGQLHLGVLTGAGVIHADARAGRVVERPGVPPWPMPAVWRSGED